MTICSDCGKSFPDSVLTKWEYDVTNPDVFEFLCPDCLVGEKHLRREAEENAAHAEIHSEPEDWDYEKPDFYEEYQGDQNDGS